MSLLREAKRGFLPLPNEEDSQADSDLWHHEKSALRARYLCYFAIAQIILLTLLGGLLLFFGKLLKDPHVAQRDEFVYTPAMGVDWFQKKDLNLHLYKDTPYKGPPNPEVDAAWNELFANAYIRLSEDELEKLGRPSTLIQDGSGDYLGALDVYHQLHCVNFIFRYVHQEYYTLKKINVPDEAHINHCIDTLREVIMCFADTTVSTFAFYEDYYKAWPQFHFQHSCRNFEAIDAWAGAPGRGVNQSDHARLERLMMNPNYVGGGEHQFDGHGEPD